MCTCMYKIIFNVIQSESSIGIVESNIDTKLLNTEDNFLHVSFVLNESYCVCTVTVHLHVHCMYVSMCCIQIVYIIAYIYTMYMHVQHTVVYDYRTWNIHIYGKCTLLYSCTVHVHICTHTVHVQLCTVHVMYTLNCTLKLYMFILFSK